MAFKAHLTAIEQYSGQAAHLRRWGYPKLADHFDAEVADELVHQSRILARLEYYDIAPDYQHEAPNWPRHDVVGIFEADLELESAAAEIEKKAILAARTGLDEVTAVAIGENLEGSQSSIAEIEAVLEVIKTVTLANYLANQI